MPHINRRFYPSSKAFAGRAPNIPMRAEPEAVFLSRRAVLDALEHRSSSGKRPDRICHLFSNRKGSHAILILLCVVVACVSTVWGERVIGHGETASHRGVYEITFRAEEDHGNPYFDAALRVEFTRPDKSKVVVEGFYDGERTFKARAYCDTTGTWIGSDKAAQPVVLDEDRYEHWREPENPRYFFRRLMWANLLSGGHATYGGLRTYEPYDGGGGGGVQGYFDANRAGKLAGGADDFVHIHRFFADTGLTLVGMEPADELVGGEPHQVKCIGNGDTYIGTVESFKCAADRSVLRYEGRMQPRLISYAMNAVIGFRTGWVNSGAPHIKSVRKVSDITGPGPTQVYTLLDEHENSINDAHFLPFVDTIRFADNGWLDAPSGRHGNGAGFAFADGHTEIRRWQSEVSRVERGSGSGTPRTPWPMLFIGPATLSDFTWATNRIGPVK
jgi:prepilin-type processing-associated H-X9-DG protein